MLQLKIVWIVWTKVQMWRIKASGSGPGGWTQIWRRRIKKRKRERCKKVSRVKLDSGRPPVTWMMHLTVHYWLIHWLTSSYSAWIYRQLKVIVEFDSFKFQLNRKCDFNYSNELMTGRDLVSMSTGRSITCDLNMTHLAAHLLQLAHFVAHLHIASSWKWIQRRV